MNQSDETKINHVFSKQILYKTVPQSVFIISNKKSKNECSDSDFLFSPFGKPHGKYLLNIHLRSLNFIYFSVRRWPDS